MATVRATRQAHPVAAVTFTKMNDMAITATPLNEYVDVDAEALTDAPLTVNLAEYGKATVTTARLRGTSFIEFDPTVSNRLGYNAGQTMDRIARVALDQKVATTLVAAGTLLTSAKVREVKARLENANVRPYADGYYRAIISPYIAQDLRAETDLAGWRAPHNYVNTGEIYAGEVGEYEGFRFISVPSLAYSGGATKRTSCFFMGEEGLAKAYSSRPGFGSFPTVRPGPVTDKLLRFRPMGWYWLGGYKLFRDEAVIKLDLHDSINGVGT
jgi:N4-gp56 family major capsid protein